MYTCVSKGFEEYKYYNCSLYSFCNEMSRRTAIPPSEQPELRMMKTIAHVRKHTHFIT